ncbi:MAG TPA: ABC transporter transmembrane domain-containing protein [Chloroflexota bacterium]|nr:ABC transporter transmembrane domain-containing protein [Chloroflexota bacterium]
MRQPHGERPVQGFDWRVRETPHFIFHYLPDSYASDHLPWLVERAERAWRDLRAFVGEDMPAPPPIKVYLLLLLPHPEQPGEQLARGAYADVKTGEIWAVCRPESPAEGLEEAIGHLLVFQPYAPGAGEVPFLREGLVAYIMAHAIGDGLVRRGPPSAERVHRVPREMLERGEPFVIFPWLVERSAVNQREHVGLALSFFTFLATQYGVAALQAYLGNYDLHNPDAAADVAYRKPVAALNDEWIATVARLVGSQVSLTDFFRRLLPYVKPYPWQVVAIMFCLLISLAFSFGLQLSVKFLIDNVIGPGNLSLLYGLLAVLMVAFVLNALLSLARAYLTAWVSEKILLSLRLTLFEHLLRLSASFYARARIGDIVSRLSNDLVVVQMALSQAALTGIFYLLSFSLGTIVLFVLDWRLALVVVVMLPLLFVATTLLSGRVVAASRDRSERLAEVTNALSETLNAQAVVRAFGLQSRMIEQFAAELDHLFGSAVRLVRLGSLFGLSSGLITSLIQIFVLGLGAYLIIADRSLTLGVLFSFTGLLSSVTSPVEQFTQLLQALQQAAGSMQRVVQILDEREEVADAPDAVPLPRLQRELRFDNVWFSYTGDRPTLQNVSLSIPAGSHVAIVGPSGAGKSSVINLILRFYDPQQGQILLDGVDLRAGTQRSLRDQMAVVFQDTFVFNTTIRENLAYGRLGATDEEIIAAARQAEIHDFILSLPAGYDTVVGERGARLSGGQRQRLAIARALLRNPAILLLDEATSALDPETEAQIQATLSQVTEQLTTIAVTHRLASAANADRIFVLNGGVLVEQGTHAELMAARGLYARLYEEQQGAALAGVATTVEASRLRRVPLFADLPPEALAAIASRLELERYAPGDTIIRQGDLGDKLYLVDRGQVEVTVNNGPMGEQRLNSLHEGDYFGEIALLLDIPRTASVTALGPVQLLSLSKADFRQLVERLPGVAQRLAPTMQGRLAQQEQLLGAES